MNRPTVYAKGALSDGWCSPEEVSRYADAMEAQVARLTGALERIRGMCDVPDNRYGTRAVYVCADTALSHAPDHTGEEPR